MSTIPCISKADIKHRRQTAKFVETDANGFYAAPLKGLLDIWNFNNDNYFDGKLNVPYILLSSPTSAKAIGDYSCASSLGGKGQIRLRVSVLTGSHKMVKSGEKYKKGRWLIVCDILLHEMIHQWQHEIDGDMEESYHGHGASFRDKCNEIGEVLGLGKVRTSKARGADKALPSCASFPHNVRPDDYYLGALADKQLKTTTICGGIHRAWNKSGLMEKVGFVSANRDELVNFMVYLDNHK